MSNTNGQDVKKTVLDIITEEKEIISVKNEPKIVNEVQPVFELDELAFEGTDVKIGKKTYVLPPLPVTKLHKYGVFGLEQKLKEAELSGDASIFGNTMLDILNVIFEAFKMNYPGISRESTVDLISMGQLLKVVFPAIIDTPSGLEEVKNV